MAKRRGCLGCSFPLTVILLLVVLAIVGIGFLAGALGQPVLDVLNKLFNTNLTVPGWIQVLSVPQPEVHLSATTLFNIGPIPITNSIVASWLTIVVLVLVCWGATRRMKVVPGRFQAIFEFLVGWIYNFCVSVMGEKNGRRFFPLVATIFLYVAFNAWLGLLPGFGSITLNHHELLRPANTDINTPAALAIVSFCFVLVAGIKASGIGYLEQYLNIRQSLRGFGQLFRGKIKAGFKGIFMGLIDIFVGLLEFLSHLIRILSFTFRLFGNMTAGEILLLVAAYLLPWFFAIPFYGLELLVGFVQALIFAGLTLVFLAVAVSHHGSE
jgi:F-type H+-transporting ATPase subunit a